MTRDVYEKEVVLTHVGQKPDRFDFHGANAEITFQVIQVDILVSFIFK